MNYPTELYLDYLNDALIYETIYINYAADLVLREALPGAAEVAMQIKKLQASKAGITDPSQLAQINTQIQQLQGTAATAATAAAPGGVTAGRTAGGPGGPQSGADPSVAVTQTPVRDVPGGQSVGMPGGQKAAPTTPAPAGPTGTSSADAIAQNKAKVDMNPVTADTPVPGGDVSTLGQIKQGAADTVEKGKELAGDLATKAKEVGGDVVSKGAELGKQAGDVVSTKLQGLGTDPSVAGGVGSAIQAVTGSPLGLAALGGAAAFGGYKLYKRFMSKSASACRGYSGGDKTSCMRSYMDAKRNQAQTRGSAVGAT